jgi:hypothetical protein
MILPVSFMGKYAPRDTRRPMWLVGYRYVRAAMRCVRNPHSRAERERLDGVTSILLQTLEREGAGYRCPICGSGTSSWADPDRPYKTRGAFLDHHFYRVHSVRAIRSEMEESTETAKPKAGFGGSKEKNLSPTSVYWIQCEGTGHIKIGLSSHPESRLKTMHSSPLTVFMASGSILRRKFWRPLERCHSAPNLRRLRHRRDRARRGEVLM